MSRSRRKNPICGNTCARSEKWDKRKANRRLRAAHKKALDKVALDVVDFILNELVLPRLREVSNVWTFQKDGKQWLKDRAKYRKALKK